MVDGKITDEIIKLSKNQVVDIIMVGRKQGFKGSGLNEKNADMIILGSKGRSAAAFLLGSVAEQLMIQDADIPLFIVKKSNENLSFINTLLKI